MDHVTRTNIDENVQEMLLKIWNALETHVLLVHLTYQNGLLIYRKLNISFVLYRANYNYNILTQIQTLPWKNAWDNTLFIYLHY